jgi:hypothetical protein
MLLLHGPLKFEDLQAKAKLRRSDDQFGQVMGDLAEKRGKRAAGKPVEWWSQGDTRFYAIKASVLVAMVRPA